MNFQGNVSNNFQMEVFAGFSQIHQKAQYIEEQHYVPKELCAPDCYCNVVWIYCRRNWMVSEHPTCKKHHPALR